MADTDSLLSTLFSGGASSSDPLGGMQALSQSEPTTGGSVLARLRGNQGGGGGYAGGMGGVIGSAMGTPLKPGSGRGSAFIQGFGGALKSGAEQETARQNAALALMKLQWDMKLKQETLDESKKQHAALAKYYEGMVANGASKKDKDEDPNSVENFGKNMRARADQAKILGLHDTVLNHHARGTGMNSNDYVTPDERKAAQDELDRRLKMYNDWDTHPDRPWNNGKKGKVTPPPAGDPDTPGPNTDPDTPDPDVPLPPSRPTDLTPATPATPAPATPAETLRPVIGPNGEKMLWGPQSGLVPFNEGQGATAVPGTPPPPGMTAPDDELPGFAG